MAATPTRASEANLDLIAAAERLGISKYTLRHWAVVQHRLPFLRLGKKILFAPRDLRDFEDESRVPARHAPRASRSA